MKNQLLVHAVVAAMLAMSTSSMAESAKAPAMEKCYGIAKAGKNDCGVVNGHACAGLSKKSGEGKAWIFVPKGTCDKIVGGSTTPKE